MQSLGALLFQTPTYHTLILDVFNIQPYQRIISNSHVNGHDLLACLLVLIFFIQGSPFSSFYCSSIGVDGVNAGVPPHWVFTLFVMVLFIGPLYVWVIKPIGGRAKGGGGQLPTVVFFFFFWEGGGLSGWRSVMHADDVYPYPIM